MKHIDADISVYDPREHRSDSSAVFSGFVLLTIILVALFLA